MYIDKWGLGESRDLGVSVCVWDVSYNVSVSSRLQVSESSRARGVCTIYSKAV